ncbi:DNA polymerase III subunit [Myxococcota bacterium]|jgi:DNA polymerase-3 subunit delta'|nr:DNA polymerase III subunit [Myxococcota bacterium]MBU1412199.1 DNA polymerase III subunit [Myxococcota bacterium]MBU1511335.1 DNA polymerase III subunit [Myxococcota bacterium]
MNSISTYTRHILGHETVIDGFAQAAAQDRFPHACLFAGPDGVGKRTLAVALASYLLQDTAHSFDRVRDGIHPDYLFVDTAWGVDNATATIKIEAIRQLEERIVVGSFESARLAVVIDPADAMTDSAANALLKTLEEPPAGVYFFLITSSPYKLPATIRSRCQIFHFAPLPEEQLFELVRLKMPDLEPDPDLASLCDGSVGRALSFYASESVSRYPALASEILGLAFSGTLPDLFGAAETLAQLERDQVDAFLLVFSMKIRDRFLGRGAAEPPRPADPVAWQQAVELARADVVANVNRRVVLENLLWKLRRT